MRPVSERALRRWAWAGWWLALAAFLAGLPFLGRGAEPDAQSWGGGGPVSGVAFGLVVLTFPLVGLLVLREQPRNTIGWLLQAIGTVWAVNGLATVYAVYGMVVAPGSLPGAAYAAAVTEAAWVPAIGLMGTFLVLLFPDGRLPSPRWRPVAWVCALTMVLGTLGLLLGPGTMEESPVPRTQNPLAWEAGAPLLRVVMVAVLPLLPVGIVACAVALVRRFRSSRGVERLQLTWLALGGAAVALLYLLTMLSVLLVETTGVSEPGAGWVRLLQVVSLLSFGLVPAAIGVAVLRHGLYDVGLVVNRALVYTGLTATLAAVYVASVLLLQLVLSPLTQDSDLAVAGSTLAVAGLSGPARRGIQRVVDRRFYRSRYDAGRTVEEFTRRLRHQVDLDAVGSDLRATVGTSLQPSSVSLWLRL